MTAVTGFSAAMDSSLSQPMARIPQRILFPILLQQPCK